MGFKVYKECYVAFLDILGYKEFIKNNDCGYIYETLEVIGKSVNFNFANFVDESVDINSIMDQITFNWISDSIVISIDSELQYSLDMLLFIVCKIQFECLVNFGILLRGAIARGAFFAEGNKLFGQAMVDSYLLEENEAKFPRVIFTKSLFDEHRRRARIWGHSEDIASLASSLDDDEYYFADYLKLFFYYLKMENIDYKDVGCKAVDDLVSSTLANSTNSRVREKYIWLKKYCERVKSERDQE